MSEGNLPSGEVEYKFNHKRNTSVKLPPPIRTDGGGLVEAGGGSSPQPDKSPADSSDKISVRQDSNVSSDSFSQTSSPSYTTKSMEAPLLPAKSAGVRRKKFHSERIRDIPPIQIEGGELTLADQDPNTSPITKSHSTPASLQTIVRFHNGSNMSLHHKVFQYLLA
jgi:corin